MDEEEIKIKMDDGVAGFFTRFGGNFLFVDLLFIAFLYSAILCSRADSMRTCRI